MVEEEPEEGLDRGGDVEVVFNDVHRQGLEEGVGGGLGGGQLKERRSEVDLAGKEGVGFFGGGRGMTRVEEGVEGGGGCESEVATGNRERPGGILRGDWWGSVEEAEEAEEIGCSEGGV